MSADEPREPPDLGTPEDVTWGCTIAVLMVLVMLWWMWSGI